MRIIFIDGPDGSGKTTLAQLIAAGQEKAIHIEPDQFFISPEGEYKFDESKVEDAKNHAKINLRWAMREKQPFILFCPQFYKSSEKWDCVNMAKRMGYEAQIIHTKLCQ